jgi:hypothetical protein
VLFMNILNKLERRLGRYALRNLMRYVVALYVAGLVIGVINPYAFTLLSLNFNEIARGQVWRLVTFIVPQSSIYNIIFVFFKAYIFYIIGNALERAWGAFRLNLYFFSGVLFNVLAALIVFLITGQNIGASIEYVYSSMFFAFAALYPNTQFLIYFIIPVKVKYLAWLNGAIYIYIIMRAIIGRNYLSIITIVVSLANFLIFFLATRNYMRISPREFERKARYRRMRMEGIKQSGNVTHVDGHKVITRHKCAVCGRTELDDDMLEFRFCSKCDGNYEYCMDHLFTHEHVTK